MDAKQKFIEKKIKKLSQQWDRASELMDTILADQMLFQYDWKAAIQTAHEIYDVPRKMALAIAKDKMDPDELNQLE